MKMSFSEYLEVVERFEEDPKQPLPAPCETCEDEVMDFDNENKIYLCPRCGRRVAKDNVIEYLQEILRRETA